MRTMSGQIGGEVKDCVGGYIPGVMQLESKRASEGRTSPFSRAFFILSSASLADLNKKHVNEDV